MLAIPRIGKTDSSQPVTPESVVPDQAPQTPQNSEFDQVLKSALSVGDGGNVSEEELFAALIFERLGSLKGTEAADKYRELLEQQKNALTKDDGFVPMEQAALRALKELNKSEVITSEEGNQIYSEAFHAAQLDDNKSALFDNRGGPGDPTIAVAALESALLAARTIIEKIGDGSEVPEGMSLDSASPTGGNQASSGGSVPTGSSVTPDASAIPDVTVPQGTTVDGADGFLFKPISDNDGRLAILLPAQITGAVMNVLLKDENGEVVEEGRPITAGISETGREKWSFGKQGGEYPANLTVEVQLQDGSIKTYSIPDPSQRYD